MGSLTDRVAALCHALPDVEERVSHARPTWFRKGKAFLTLHPDGHHQNTFPHLWAAAPPGVQEERIAGHKMCDASSVDAHASRR